MIRRSDVVRVPLLTRRHDAGLARACSVTPSYASRFRALECSLLVFVLFVCRGDEAWGVEVTRYASSFRFLASNRNLLNASGLRFTSSSALAALRNLRIRSNAGVRLRFIDSGLLRFLLDRHCLPTVRVNDLLIVIVRCLQGGLLIYHVTRDE